MKNMYEDASLVYQSTTAETKNMDLNKANLTSLPYEVMVSIFSYLTPNEVYRTRLTCKYLFACCPVLRYRIQVREVREGDELDTPLLHTRDLIALYPREMQIYNPNQDTIDSLGTWTQLNKLTLKDDSVHFIGPNAAPSPVIFLSSLSSLVNLRELSLEFFGERMKVCSLEFLTPLAMLESLTLYGFGAFVYSTSFLPLVKVTSLRYLTIDGCWNLQEVNLLSLLSQLTSLTLGNCLELKDISPLAKLQNLKSLSIAESDNIRDFGPIAGLIGLTSLDLTNSIHSISFVEIGSLTSLTELKLKQKVFMREYGLEYMTMLIEMKKLVSLRDLEVTVGTISQIKCVSLLTQLESLKVRGSGYDVYFDPLSSLIELRSLSLGYGSIGEWSFLQPLHHLTHFEIFGVDIIKSIPFSESLPITHMCYKYYPCTFDSVRGMLNLNNLRYITIDNCPITGESREFQGLKSLISISIVWSNGVRTFFM